jgi:hypothetical protein
MVVTIGLVFSFFIHSLKIPWQLINPKKCEKFSFRYKLVFYEGYDVAQDYPMQKSK